MSDSDSNNNKKNGNLMSGSSESDLGININASPFHHSKELLEKRSSKVSLLLERNEMDEQRLIPQDLEVDPKTFEDVRGLEVKFSSDNIVSVLCKASNLGMNEEQCSNNLFGKAFEFLKERVLPSWNETVNALRSGDENLDKLADVGLIGLFFDSLIEKASYDPRLLGEVIKEGNDYRTNARRRLFVTNWKSEDVITLQLWLYEPLMIRALKSNSSRIPVEYIALSVCKYAKKWVFDAEERQLRKRRLVVEAVERILPHTGVLVSCDFLFESLKHSIWLNASSKCRNGFEIRISKQLHMARSTDFKILSRGYKEKEESFEDIQLVKTVVKRFFIKHANKHPEATTRLEKVTKLLEEFLFLAASETSLKLEAFVALAKITVAVSKGISRYSDGIYKAIDAFLESHRYLNEPEQMEVCNVLDCNKLSQEGCEQVVKNQRLPLRIVVQVLFATQLQIRDTMAKEIKVREEKVDEEKEKEEEKEEGEIGVSSDEDETEEMRSKLLGRKIENQECVVHRWKKIKKISVWRQLKRKFGCLTSSSSQVDACTCDIKKKKKKKFHHHY